MKIPPHIPSRLPRRGDAGFTLVEMMVSATIFMAIYVGVMVAVQVLACAS